MEELLKSREFWLSVFGVMMVISIVRALYDFNKFILFIVLVIAVILSILYIQPAWLTNLWGSFQ